MFSFGIGSALIDLGMGIAGELSGAFDSIIDFSDPTDILRIVNGARAQMQLPPFDPKAFLNSNDGQKFVENAFFNGVTDIGGKLLGYEKRGIKALEALAVAAEACNVSFDLKGGAPARAPAFGVASAKSLSDFLQENGLGQTKDELMNHGFQTVRALKTTAEEEGSQSAFTTYMRKEGVRLSGGNFSELYTALMHA